jgi:hypothetical protein
MPLTTGGMVFSLPPSALTGAGVGESMKKSEAAGGNLQGQREQKRKAGVRQVGGSSCTSCTSRIFRFVASDDEKRIQNIDAEGEVFQK